MVILLRRAINKMACLVAVADFWVDFLGFLLSLPLENANCDKVKGFNNFIFRYLKLQRRARFGGRQRVVLYIGNSPPMTKKILIRHRNPQYL